MNNKKKYGQFFTNPVIADFMTRMAVDDNSNEFLDPAVGPGVFALLANKLNPSMNIDVYEIDPIMIDSYNENVKFNTNINNSDFLYSECKKYDSIVCNPPYNKFQEIPDRKELIELFYSKYDIKLSGYTNYCVYFLIKCLNQMSDNGKCVFIMPYEFMNNGYGENVKKYILGSKKLKMLIKFNNKLKIFDDAITTSCILFFENKKHDTINFIEVFNIDELNSILNCDYSLLNYHNYNYNDLNYKDKWSSYFVNEIQCFSNLVSFKTMAQVKRGIATGNNKYFALSKDDINKYSLSKNVCIPCVSKAPDINELIMDDRYFNYLSNLNKKMFVFDGRKKVSSFDDKYIFYGKKIGVDKTYLNSHRNPWYGIEDKEAAPIWISVFSRGKLKVIRNEILIKNLTSFHGIYINPGYEKYTNILFCYLQTPIAQKILKMNKREYGEGLDKFEPNDINNANILNFSVINDDDRLVIQSIYDNYKINKKLDIDALNVIFLKYIIA